MPNKKLILIGLIAISCNSFANNPSTAVQASDFIDVFHKLFGEHKGQRKNHIKGVCAAGEFTPSKQAALYSSSALYSGAAVPALMRFSLPGGNPSAPDVAKSPRGFAVQFSLPNGAKHNIAGLNTPVFAAKDPATFLGLLQASIPAENGKPDKQRIKAFKDAHPDTQPMTKWMGSHPPPYSYVTSSYYGIHTFFMQNKAEERVKIRWQLVPQLGERGLTDDEIAAAPANFLAQRLADSVQSAPVVFDWVASIGEPEDVNNDPTVRWPADRPQVNLGKLVITSSGGEECTGINFDPNVLSSGVYPSDDPVLKMRSPAYAISFGKRLSGQ